VLEIKTRQKAHETEEAPESKIKIDEEEILKNTVVKAAKTVKYHDKPLK